MSAVLQDARALDAGPGEGFALRQVDSRLLERLALHGPVLKRSTLQALTTAREVLAAAHLEAAAIVAAGHQEAERAAAELLQTRETELAQRESTLATEMWGRMAAYSEAVARDWEHALLQLEAGAQGLVSDALTRLSAELPPEARIRACVRELVRQGVQPDTGVLQVSAADVEVLDAIATLEGLAWPVQVHADLRPGCLRLASAHGRWEVEVAGVLSDLQEALSSDVPAHHSP